MTRVEPKVITTLVRENFVRLPDFLNGLYVDHLHSSGDDQPGRCFSVSEGALYRISFLSRAFALRRTSRSLSKVSISIAWLISTQRASFTS